MRRARDDEGRTRKTESRGHRYEMNSRSGERLKTGDEVGEMGGRRNKLGFGEGETRERKEWKRKEELTNVRR